MKKTLIRSLAILLCTALLAGGATVYAANSAKTQSSVSEKVTGTTETATAQNTAAELTKDETVYVLAGADGAVQKIIVSDWIKNALNEASVTDESDLENVERVRGEGDYTLNGDTMRVWDAQGDDIYYQGNIEKELPVSLSVSYTLDGKSISVQDLAGKSGRVTLRFDYQNNQYETVEIDGKQEKIYVPFVMLTGVLLDNEVFSNVEVTNGKLINDGDRTAVVGLAFPGLQSNLNLSKNRCDIPDCVEISADVKNFEMTNTVTLATNEVFSKLDTEKMNSVEGLTDSLGELTDAMDQLMDGSSQLYDGLCTLLEKSGQLVEGIDQLAQGAAALKTGAANLDGGAGRLSAGLQDLAAGLGTLTSNNDQLSAGSRQVFDTLLGTANTQLAAAGLSVPTLTVENYAQVLKELIASLDDKNVAAQAQAAALEKVMAAVNAQRQTITAAVTEKVRESVTQLVTAQVRESVTPPVTAQVRESITPLVTAQVRQNLTASVTEQVRTALKTQVLNTLLQMTPEEYAAAVADGSLSAEQQAEVESATDAQLQTAQAQAQITSTVDAQLQTAEVQAQITAAVDAQLQTAEVQAQITAAVDAQLQTAEVQAKITSAVDTQMQTAEVQAQITAATEEQVATLIKQNMNSAEVQSQITQALQQAASGAASISALKAQLDSYNDFYTGLASYIAGVNAAKAGADSLVSGASELKSGTAQLCSGANQLYDGVLTLKNGAPALTEGITQLRDGAMQLSNGLKEFNEKGVQKLVDAMDGDIGSLFTRIQATVDVSKHYKNFSGLAKEMDGEVKFVYRTDAVSEN